MQDDWLSPGQRGLERPGIQAPGLSATHHTAAIKTNKAWWWSFQPNFVICECEQWLCLRGYSCLPCYLHMNRFQALIFRCSLLEPVFCLASRNVSYWVVYVVVLMLIWFNIIWKPSVLLSFYMMGLPPVFVNLNWHFKQEGLEKDIHITESFLIHLTLTHHR